MGEGLRRVTWILVCGLLSAAASTCLGGPSGRTQFTIRADWYDRGNAAVFPLGGAYADKYPCIANGGVAPNQAEWDLEFPVTADYTLSVLYASAESRPMDIYLDGQELAQGLTAATGGFDTSRAAWEKQLSFHVEKGMHTIKIVRPGPCMPHVVALRLESSVPLPAGWKLDRPASRRVRPSVAEEKPCDGTCGYVADPPPVYDYHQSFDRLPPPLPMAQRMLEYLLIDGGKYPLTAEVVPFGEAATGDSPETNELARGEAAAGAAAAWVARLSVRIDDRRTQQDVLPLVPGDLHKMLDHTVLLVERFRAMPGVAADYLAGERARAAALGAEAKGLLTSADSSAKWRKFFEIYCQAYRLKHRVALANPMLGFGRLLFARRLSYNSSHIYTTHFDGSTRFKAGGGIYELAPLRPDGRLRALAAGLKSDGIFRDAELSFDAQKVLFSYKPDPPTAYHVYEVGIDGNGLRQVTSGPYDDVDARYLPDGKRIVFVSTRCRRVVLCHNAFTVSVLHTMNRDGSDVRCISPNTVNDFRPNVTPSGQIAFTRWEYVEKHAGNNQSLWVTRPDGTQMAHVAGAHFGPLTYWDAYRIPESRFFACILAPHMPFPAGHHRAGGPDPQLGQPRGLEEPHAGDPRPDARRLAPQRRRLLRGGLSPFGRLLHCGLFLSPQRRASRRLRAVPVRPLEQPRLDLSRRRFQLLRAAAAEGPAAAAGPGVGRAERPRRGRGPVGRVLRGRRLSRPLRRPARRGQVPPRARRDSQAGLGRVRRLSTPAPADLAPGTPGPEAAVGVVQLGRGGIDEHLRGFMPAPVAQFLRFGPRDAKKHGSIPHAKPKQQQPIADKPPVRGLHAVERAGVHNRQVRPGAPFQLPARMLEVQTRIKLKAELPLIRPILKIGRNGEGGGNDPSERHN